MATEGTVREYQVRQTEDGIDVTCVTGGHLATTALAARLEHALRQAGLAQPHVSIKLAETITRAPDTAKVSRFIPQRVQPATAAVSASLPHLQPTTAAVLQPRARSER